MPELPEVQFAADLFRQHLGGQTLSRIVVSQPSVVRPNPTAYAQTLKNCQITSVERCGKHILVSLRSGTRESQRLAIHLGMTGKLIWGPSKTVKAQKYICVRWVSNSGEIGFVDMRRFGRTMAGPEEQVRDATGISRLGVDALEVSNGEHLGRCLGKTNKPIKSALLDQHRIAGLGNIQACEALFRANLSPWKRTGELTDDEFASLHQAIQSSLGDTLRDLEQSAFEGGPKYFGDGLTVNPFQVYRKDTLSSV